MSNCKHYAICGLDSIQGEDFCILHSQNPEKDEEEFDKALAAHIVKNAHNSQHFVFPGRANFSGVTFTEWASFFYARFTQGADFSHAKFTASATIFEATFTNYTKFSEAEFAEWADFRVATFNGQVSLRRCRV